MAKHGQGGQPDQHTDEDFQANVNTANATTAQTVKAAVASSNHFITDVVISTDTALNLWLEDDTGTPVVLLPKLYMPANSVYSKTFDTPIRVGVGKALKVKASGAGNISVLATGYVTARS